MNNKAVVVFSGGQDSTTCLFWAMEQFDEVIAVTFDYGQRHKLEIECAKEIANELGVEHHIRIVGIVVHCRIEFHLAAVLERVAHGRVLAEPVAEFYDGGLV